MKHIHKHTCEMHTYTYMWNACINTHVKCTHIHMKHTWNAHRNMHVKCIHKHTCEIHTCRNGSGRSWHWSGENRILMTSYSEGVWNLGVTGSRGMTGLICILEQFYNNEFHQFGQRILTEEPQKQGGHLGDSGERWLEWWQWGWRLGKTS